ncbi:pyroglutamyl-peptidase I [Erysipelothrix piscisicarius]|uniref:Pyrrolidone-carboxylate peptidase n=1 Tax=Erysipelothrix piscisicarius TaxID=2485784 RepID=A0A3S8RP12_9FIRM|nr:pyroglutamyl-peptidase I [Erysipelothrix piscisicarius]AZK44671.1 pyroglutamyl-peptidase I [Erysipelothrix piscisicarius]
MKVLITGFDPFGGEKMNPAYEAVKLLPDTIEGAEVLKLEVPTVFNKSVEVLDEAMAKHQPDIVICVGQAGNRFGVTPERVAINQDDARIKDNEGNQPIDETIFEDGKAAYFATLPIKAMVENMKQASIPASVSNTAGTFVCNHLMYGLLYLVDKKYSNVRGGFIHVPFATQQVMDKPTVPSLTLEQIAKGLEVCIATAVTVKEDHKIQGGAIS